MKEFTAKFGERIQGVISGFDRLVLRGSLRRLCYGRGMEEYLWQNKILFKDYAQHVKKISERVKKAALAPFVEQKLPVVYVRGHQDKERIARTIAAQRGIGSGDVCALSSLEPSPTFEHYGTHMVARTRPCLVIYHYRIDPEWGWMNARQRSAAVSRKLRLLRAHGVIQKVSKTDRYQVTPAGRLAIL